MFFNGQYVSCTCDMYKIGCGHPRVLETSVYLCIPISKGLHAINVDMPHTSNSHGHYYMSL